MSKKEKSPKMNSEKMEDSSTILDDQTQKKTESAEDVKAKSKKRSKKLTKEEKLKLKKWKN